MLKVFITVMHDFPCTALLNQMTPATHVGSLTYHLIFFDSGTEA